jgi:hypothetical protein
MLRIRICAAGAVTAVFLAAMISVSGAAVGQGGDQPGKPAVLAGLAPPHEEPHQKGTMAHAKTRAKTAHKTAAAKSVKIPSARLAATVTAKAAADAPPAPLPGALPEKVWPAPAQTAPANVAAEPAAEPAAATDNPELGALVVHGQTVEIKPADEINEIDLAANNQDAEASTAAPTDRADLESVAAPTVAVASREAKNPIGSASWIAQVLAALGGAIAAGSVAWFLIGSGPQRTYG